MHVDLFDKPLNRALFEHSVQEVACHLHNVHDQVGLLHVLLEGTRHSPVNVLKGGGHFYLVRWGITEVDIDYVCLVAWDAEMGELSEDS